jgi:thermitase
MPLLAFGRQPRLPAMLRPPRPAVFTQITLLGPCLLAIGLLVSPSGTRAQTPASDRVLVKLYPAPTIARLHATDRESALRALNLLAGELEATSLRPLFPMDGGPALRRAARPTRLPGSLPPESEGARLARRNRFGLDRWVVLDLSGDEKAAEAVARLSENPLVELATPDHQGRGAARYIPNDPQFNQQWYLDQASDADIDMPEAWDLRRSTPILIAVLDTGVDFAHPDLTGIFENGWDYVNDDSSPADDQGHGTHVTGLIAARGGNGIGIAGAAFDAHILPVKVLDSENVGFYSWWAAGFVLAADLGAPVINLSAGGVSFGPALNDAVLYAVDRGSVVCVAMMNQNSAVPYYPAAYNETIAVGATDSSDERAVPLGSEPGSSYGSHIDLVAPGDGLLSTRRGGGYGTGSGTSFATPLVSGVVALMVGADGGIDTRILRETADDQVGLPGEDTAGFDIYHGAGRLNAEAAMLETLSDTPPPSQRLQALPAWPNPSAGLARIGFNQPAAGPVTVRIYDTRGRLIRTAAEAQVFPAGQSYVIWDGRSGDGREAPSGIYLYEIIAGTERVTGKLIRLR